MYLVYTLLPPKPTPVGRMEVEGLGFWKISPVEHLKTCSSIHIGTFPSPHSVIQHAKGDATFVLSPLSGSVCSSEYTAAFMRETDRPKGPACVFVFKRIQA